MTRIDAVAHRPHLMMSAGAGLARRAPALPAADDMEALLAKLQVQRRDSTRTSAEANARGEKVQREEALQHAHDAEEAAKQAQEKSSFWGKVLKVTSTVATIAAVVAAAASVVFSAGTTAPAAIALAGAVLSASSPLIAKAAGDKAGKIAMWGGAALSLGGAAWGALSSTAAETMATTANEALAAKAATLANAATDATEASTAMQAAHLVKVGAQVTEGGAQVVQGYSTVRQKNADAVVEERRADEALRRNDVTRANQRLDDIAQNMAVVEASVRRAMAGVVELARERQHTRQEVLNRMGRSVIA